MVDFFAIGLTHALLALVALRLMLRDDLDRDPEPVPPGTGEAGTGSDA